MKFSIIIVCLNAGERLSATVDSVLGKSYENYEIVLKDGGSTDGSVEKITETVHDERLNICQKKDRGIYDAMNQAIELACGDYLIFMNAGDSFYDKEVLDKIAHVILNKTDKPGIIYGNLYHKGLSTVIYAPPAINDFTTRPVFTVGRCSQSGLIILRIMSARIMSIFCGAFTKKRRISVMRL